MVKRINKSDLWKLALALCSVALCVAIFVGVLTNADFSGNAEEPTYVVTGVSLKDDAVVCDDYDEDTIKEILVVTAYEKDNESNVVSNLDAKHYVVQINSDGLLSTESINTVKVTGSGGGEAQTLTIDAEDVVPITPELALVPVDSALQFDGEFWRNDDDIRSYAYTQGMDGDVTSLLKAVAVYPHKGEVDLTDAVINLTNGTGDNSSDKHEGVFDVSSNLVSGKYTINFKQLKPYALAIVDEGWTVPDNLSSSTRISTTSNIQNAFNFTDYTIGVKYTDGQVKEKTTNTVPVRYLSVVGSLTPTADYFTQLAQGSAASTYTTTIGFKGNGVGTDGVDYSELLPVNIAVNVRFDENIQSVTIIDNRNELTPDEIKQYARQDFNFAGLYFNFRYNAAASFQTPISEKLEQYITGLTFYDDDISDTGKDFLTVDAMFVSFDYEVPVGNGKTSSGTSDYFTIDVLRGYMPLPEVETFTPEYKEGGLDITLSLDNIEQQDVRKLITVSVNNGAALVEDANGNYTISFEKGGDYIITMALESDGDFEWSPVSGEYITHSQYVLTYKIVVSGAAVTLTLENYDTSRKYGDAEPAYSIQGFVSEGSSMNFTLSSSNGNRVDGEFDKDAEIIKTNELPSYRLRYVGTSKDENNNETAYDSYICPKNRGKYTVYAETADTAFYKTSTSNKVTFTIDEYILDFANMVQSVTFDAKNHSFAEFVQLNSGSSLPYGEKINDVLNIPSRPDDYYFHAQKYDETLTIANKNYAWDAKGTLTQKVNIEITKASLSFSVDDRTFVYGGSLADGTIRSGGLKNWVNVSNTVTYYKADDSWNKVGGALTANSNTWDAGKYIAVYTTEDLAAPIGKKGQDYDLPTYNAHITVTRRAITALTISGVGGEYSGADYTFNINGWNSDGTTMGILSADIASGGSVDISKVLAISVDGKLLIDGTTAITTNITNVYDGLIKVQEAGTYTFTITIANSNYKWNGESDDAESAVVSHTAAITQAEYTVMWQEDAAADKKAWTDPISYIYTNEAHYPTLSAAESVLTLTYGFYSDAACTEPISDPSKGIVESGTYYVKVTGFTGEAFSPAAGYTQAVNYKNPVTIVQSFTIANAGLKKPTLDSSKSEVSGDTVTVTYKGDVYGITDFIADYSKYVLGTVNKLSINYTVNDTAATPVNVAVYTVSVTPAGNFKWDNDQIISDEKEAEIFTLIIIEKEITLQWSGNETYDGNGHLPTATAQDLCGVDSGKVNVTVVYGDNAESKTNAGKYTVKATGLTGTAAANYKLPAAVTHEFTIYKKEIDKPAQPNVSTTFNSTQTVSVSGYKALDEKVVSATVAGRYPSEWFGLGATDKTFDISDNTKFAFNVKTGEFTFTNAGVYSVTFTITDNNYCWKGDDTSDFTAVNVTCAWTDFASIERAEIAAPDLGVKRAMSWTESISDLTTEISNIFGSVDFTYSVLFVNRTDGASSAVQSDIDHKDGSPVRGQYYVLITLDDEFKFNYVWTDSAMGNAGANFIEDTNGKMCDIAYTDLNGAQVTVYYAITASQMDIDFEIGDFNGVTQGYMFGANGYSLGDSVLTDPLTRDKLITISGNDADKKLIEDYLGNGVNITYTFMLDGNVVTALVNNLPWYAGSYSVQIDVKFEHVQVNGAYLDETYQDLYPAKTFTVAPRPVEISWKLGETYAIDNKITTTYNGLAKAVTAAITNMPKMTSSDNTAAPAVTLYYDGSAVAPVNAKSGILVTVNGVDGTDMTENSTQTCTLVINKLEVSIVANGNLDSKHIFGNADKNLSFDYADGSAHFYNDGSVDHRDYIAIELLQNGVDYSANQLAPVGIYTVNLKWNGDETLGNNYDIKVTSATYEIIARPITVEFTSSGKTITYGDTDIDLYNENIYVVNAGDGCTGSDPLVNIVASNVFTLTATVVKDGATYTLAQYSPAGLYTVAGTAVNGNFAVTFANESGNGVTGVYTVDNAEITFKDFVGHSAEYDGILHDILASYYVKTVNNLDYVLQYRADGTTQWNDYIVDGKAVQFKNVNDTKTYYFKITADNHNESGEIPVAFKITKATLNVEVNLTIKFGEKSPVNADNTAYKTNLSDLLTSMYTVNGLLGQDTLDINELNIEGSFTYVVDGYTQGVSGVGSYGITFDGSALTADNYTFVNADYESGATKGRLTVEQLALDVTLSKVETTYYQAYGNAIFAGAVEIALPKSTYDATKEVELTTELYNYIMSDADGFKGANLIELTTTAYVDGVAQGVTAQGYIISGKLKDGAANYTATFIGDLGENKATHTIKAATLTSVEVTNYNGVYDKQQHGLNGNGWATPVDDAALTVEYYVSSENLGDADNLDWDTLELLSANPMLVNASTYYVYYRVTAANHNPLYGMGTVVINKRAISIDAQDVTLTYGDDAPEFYNYAANAVTGNTDSGLVAGDTLESIFAGYMADGKLPVYFTSPYAPGRTSGYGGNHNITCSVSDGSYHELQNYYVAGVNGATLHVNKLTVTIVIANAENFYDLSLLDGITGTYSKEERGKLTWQYADGSNKFIGSDYEGRNLLVFELHTEAWTPHNGKLTNAVIVGGGYPIYARWLTYGDTNKSFADNYELRFDGCEYAGELPADAISQTGANCAGVYTIKPAQVFVEWKGPFVNEEGTIDAVNGSIYSGQPKYYKATVKIAEGADDVKFDLTYYNSNTGSKLDSAPVNYGSYRVTATTADSNYVAGFSAHTFDINRATLNVGWKLDNSVAATIQYGEKITDFDKTIYGYPASANGRFSGLTFVFSSPHYTISDIDSDKLTETLGIKSYGYTTDYDHTKTQVGNVSISTDIVLNEDSNFVIHTQASQTLVVETRKISVWVKGLNDGNMLATSKYTGVDPLASGAWKSKIDNWLQAKDTDAFVNDHGLTNLDVVLGLATNRYDVATYGIIPSQGGGKNTNYAVTFVDGTGKEIGSDNRPEYEITKAALTVRTNNASVVYGNDLSDIMLKGVANDEVTSNFLNTYVTFSGWQHGEGYLGIYTNDSAMSDNKFVFKVDYTPYQTNVGNTLVISLDGSVLEFTNYDVSYDTANNGKLNVTRRPITAATSDREYEEVLDGSKLPVYNQGKYGAALEAQIAFANHNDGVGYNSSYLPVFTLSYDTKAVTGQPAAKAPTMVGDYNVTVTLNANSNYTFVKDGKNVNNVTLPYSVYQKTIAPTWAESALKNDAAGGEAESGLQNSLIGFVQSIMNIDRFEKTNGLTVLIPQIPEGTDADAYQIGTADNGERVGLTITATGRGEYRITLELTEAARKNYKFEGASAVSTTIIFTVSSEVVIINNLHVDDWIYLDSAKEATFDIVGGNKGDVVFTYAKVNGEVPSNPDNAWYQSLVYTAIPYEVSAYVLRAVHPSTVNADGETVGGAVEYYLFRITPRTVAAPTITTTDFVYTGGRLQAVISFNPVELRIANYAGLAYEIVDGNTVLYATDANSAGYVITFDLVDGKNYQWGEVTSLKWEISPATGSTITWNDFADIHYGETFEPNATATYGGNVTYYYMAKASASDTVKPDRDDSNWTTAFNKNVGCYWVKAERAATSNYDGAYAIESFEIKKATLTVTPVGSMVYGNTFNPVSSLFSYEITNGLVNFDTKEVIKTVDGKQVSYAIVNAPQKLDASTYGFVLNSEDGYVVGLTADNYYIVSGTGTFTVTPRPVTITLGNASSQYGMAIDLEDVTVNFSDEMAEQEIELSLYATANTTSDCDIYKISATYSNGNYLITLVDGVYTVTQRQVTVRIDSVADVEYGSTVSNPIKYSVLDGNGEDITSFVNAHNFTLRVSYSGRTNGGTMYPESETMPTLAGTYTATVRGSGNANFIVVGEPFTSFVLSKKEVDGSLIKIAGQAYTGQALTPVINSDEFEAMYGKNIYEVGSLSGFVNVGSHSVTLTLSDFDNYKWKSVEIISKDIQFVITQAVNEAIVDLTIKGWTYGEYSAADNMPSITVKFGQANVQFVYSATQNGEYKAGAPEAGAVGDYYVKAKVAETNNYRSFESAPVKFAITKKALAQPKLTIVNDGEGKNDVYTGGDLLSTIVGFNMALMNLDYEGKFNVSAGQVVVIAVNAGTYTVKLSIADTHNYCWQGADSDEVTLSWTIAPKAVAKPTANTSKFMVNGQVLTYIPQGFDETVMAIEGNQTAYGGEFPVTVSLKDKANYVWEDGTTDDFTLNWSVVGANTVFIIIVSSLGGACGIAVLAAGLQFLMDRRKKRIIDRDIDARSQADEDKANQGGNK